MHIQEPLACGGNNHLGALSMRIGGIAAVLFRVVQTAEGLVQCRHHLNVEEILDQIPALLARDSSYSRSQNVAQDVATGCSMQSGSSKQVGFAVAGMMQVLMKGKLSKIGMIRSCAHEEAHVFWQTRSPGLGVPWMLAQRALEGVARGPGCGSRVMAGRPPPGRSGTCACPTPRRVS